MILRFIEIYIVVWLAIKLVTYLKKNRDEKRNGYKRSYQESSVKLEMTEDQMRRSIRCSFLDGITERDFEKIVQAAGRSVKSLKGLSTEGAVVFGTVEDTDDEEWYFKIDFNDYGHLTGQYWLWTDDESSSIPEYIADKISEEIQKQELPTESVDTQDIDKMRYCPACGEMIEDENAAFCTACGEKL